MSESARALPPAFPPLTRFGALPLGSSISPVAIRATMTAAPITSAGRFSPLGLVASIVFLLGYLFQPLPSVLNTTRIDDFHSLIATHEAVNLLPRFCGGLYLDRRRLTPAMRFSGSNVIL
jgi:hypothetical protein